MAAPEGNEYYKLCKNPGAPKKYDADKLRKKINEYFKHIDNTPIQKRKTETHRGEIKEIIEYLPKPYTLTGLCNYLHITMHTLKSYESDDDLMQLIIHARQIIYQNKFEGAANNTFNSNLIALELGLKAKEEQTINNIILPLGSTEIQQISKDLAGIYGKLPEPEPEIIDITEGNQPE